MYLARLSDPFPASEIEWRLSQVGESNGKIWAKCLAYVTNRAIQQRLDEVCGPENWQNEFKPGPQGGVICGLSVRIVREDGTAEWVKKWDGADNTQTEATKGGLSGAMKRAAVHWGCGRILYHLEESFATVHEHGKFRGKTKDGKQFRWDPPQLPSWALPKPDTSHADLLAFIQTTGARCDDDVEFLIRGKTEKVVGYVRSHWTQLKSDRQLAQDVASALRESLGSLVEG